MRVKICGITRSQDAKAAVDYGADAVGFVVGSPASPRNLTLTKALSLMRKIPVFTTKVAVTSTEETRTILAICSMLRPDAIQIHKHKPNLLESLRSQYPETQIILATALHDRSSIKNAIETSAYSDALLADSPGRNGIGGTGRVHDWAITASVRDQIYPHPLILAGGLTPGNVREAIRKVRPFAVDVSTGVEKKIGLKDRDKIKEFIKNAKENLS